MTLAVDLAVKPHTNKQSSDIESEIRHFADDCFRYRKIKDEEDKMKLQRDIDRLGSGARKWGMSVNFIYITILLMPDNCLT